MFSPIKALFKTKKPANANKLISKIDKSYAIADDVFDSEQYAYLKSCRIDNEFTKEHQYGAMIHLLSKCHLYGYIRNHPDASRLINKKKQLSSITQPDLTTSDEWQNELAAFIQEHRDSINQYLHQCIPAFYQEFIIKNSFQHYVPGGMYYENDGVDDQLYSDLNEHFNKLERHEIKEHKHLI